MLFTQKVGVLFVLYFGSLCSGMVPSSTSVQPILLRAELALERPKWSQAGYVSYWMSTRITCDACGSNGETMALYVNDDKALPFISSTVKTDTIRTVEGLYDWIEELADDSGGAFVKVEYDESTGYPKSISLDFSSGSNLGKITLTTTVLALRDKIGYVSNGVPISNSGFNFTEHSLNQKKWAGELIAGYKFTFTRECTCVAGYSSAFFVRARHGRVVVARYIRDGDTTLPHAVRGTLFTITDLFDVVEDIARYSDQADIDYHSSDGYITNAAIKMSFLNNQYMISMKTELDTDK